MKKIGRNDPCPCASGRKYKQCCYRSDAIPAINTQEGSPEPAATLQSAIAHHQAGRLQQAATMYQQILLAQPAEPDALHLLGVIAYQQGRHDAAVDLISQAIRANSMVGMYYSNLGNAEQKLGRIEAAITSFQHALRLQPELVDGHINLGNALKQFGEPEQAAASYQRALALNPDCAEAHNNLGNILQAQGQFALAAASLRTALRCKPDYPEAHNNLANALVKLREFDEARESYERAIALNPNYAEAHRNVGEVHKEQGELEQAVAHYQHALLSAPNFTQAHYALGHAFKDQGKLDKSITSFQKAWILDPNQAVGMEAAIRLAVLYFLENDLRRALEMTNAAQALRKCSDPETRPSRAYLFYLEKLLREMSHDAPTPPNNFKQALLHVVGDSHCLAIHNRFVQYKGRDFFCQAGWIEGCKQWSLGNAIFNRIKYAMITQLRALPPASRVLLTAGEIDCRMNGGIFKAFQKSSSGSIENLASETAHAYLAYAVKIAAEFGHRLIICGVPACNAPLEKCNSKDAALFCKMLKTFNAALQQRSLAMQLDFLDLYAMTNSGDGMSNKLWHIDDYHLRPDAYPEAFKNYLRSTEN